MIMRFVSLLLLSVVAIGIASNDRAQAQPDPNAQERANTLTSSYSLKSATSDQSTTVCQAPKTEPHHLDKAAIVARGISEGVIPFPDALRRTRDVLTALQADKPLTDSLYAVYYPVNFCDPKQKTVVKLSALSNPDYETNVLKSNTNVQHDTSYAYGGNLLVTTGGFRDFDIMGMSIGSASARYDKFPAKSSDVLNTQGIYQFFLRATANDGATIIDRNTRYDKIPAAGLITVDTVALGFVNLSNYTPTFQTRTSNLFTPQATYTHQNTALFGNGDDNVCKGSQRQPDIKKTYGFCNYIDVSFTVGRTFADVETLENVNAALEVNVGHRLDGTDLKFAVKTTLTGKHFENVPGGREDRQLQVAPTLTYSPPPLKTAEGNFAPTFTVPVTYTVNNSTLAKAEWHGVVVMPTLTLAWTLP